MKCKQSSHADLGRIGIGAEDDPADGIIPDSIAKIGVGDAPTGVIDFVLSLLTSPFLYFIFLFDSIILFFINNIIFFSFKKKNFIRLSCFYCYILIFISFFFIFFILFDYLVFLLLHFF